MAHDSVSRGDVVDAAARLAGHVHRTPVVTCRTLDELAGRSLYFKCENWQRGGAFKFRGAMNAVLTLDRIERKRGVVTHSSGNHAQALALAARSVGISAEIVMPENSPAVKVAAVRSAGGRITFCASNITARESTAAALVENTGGTLIHPYDNVRIIAGQGTCGLEIVEQVPGVDTIIAPVGGGGLLAGLTVAVLDQPDIHIFGAEPLGADDAARSLAAGERQPMVDPRTIADGLRTSLGERNWPIVRDGVREIVTVTEPEIASAMRLIFERVKLVVEPSAAVPLAAILSGRSTALANRKTIAVVLSGGNVDLDRLPWQ